MWSLSKKINLICDYSELGFYRKKTINSDYLIFLYCETGDHNADYRDYLGIA